MKKITVFYSHRYGKSTYSTVFCARTKNAAAVLAANWVSAHPDLKIVSIKIAGE